MFCSQCGQSNPEGAAFCTACGHALTQNTLAAQPSYHPGSQNDQADLPSSYSPPVSQYQGGFASQPPYQSGYGQMHYPQTPKKKRTGLIAGLSIGAFLIAAVAVVLFVWPRVLIQIAPDLKGYWYSEDRGEAIEFKSSGSVRVLTTYQNFKGRYEYDSAQGLGVITVEDEDVDFAMTNEGLKVDGMGIYEKADDDFDVDDFLDDMSGAVAVTADPMPTEQVTAIPAETPDETAAGSEQAAEILGLWYETTGYGGTMDFYNDGTYEMSTMGYVFSGTFSFDTDTASWILTEDISGESFPAVITDGYLNVDTLQYTREYVEQFDWTSEQDAN